MPTLDEQLQKIKSETNVCENCQACAERICRLLAKIKQMNSAMEALRKGYCYFCCPVYCHTIVCEEAQHAMGPMPEPSDE